jgi:small subunit ribosomal protein S7
MSRRRQATRRPVSKDGKFQSTLVARLVNTVMHCGKKSTAQRIVYGAFDTISEKNPASNPVEILQRAVDNAKPRIETKPRRVGGATYQVPVEVRTDRRQALAIRWIISAARGRNDKTMVDRLSSELLDASNNRGAAVKKREDTHRMAEANRAFAHYRW